jgi:type II secretory pathway pseudopilin PulG
MGQPIMSGNRLLKKFLRPVKGFTYLAVMFSIVLIGLSLTGAVQQWKTIMKREREAELLFRGDQIRKAIAAYQQTPGISNYPKKLEDLVKVPNISATKRFLRKVYKDPITNEDWVLVKIGDRIKGVYSKSEEEPLKQANFPDEYKFFEGKTKYSEWVFEFTPVVQTPQQPPRPSALSPAQRNP